MVAMLSLLVGFGIGRWSVDPGAARIAAGTEKPDTALATPGTTGQTPGQAYTDNTVKPSSGQAAPPVPADATPPPPKPAPREAPAKVATKPPPPPPRAARTGQILVTSTPAKASVTVDGRWTGRTPLKLENRRFGRYRIRVVQAGYDVANETITLSADNPTRTLDVTLKPIAAGTTRSPRSSSGRAPEKSAQGVPSTSKPADATTGEIFVDSRPQGAKVSIDGKLYGVTPLRVPAQAVGSHVVRLELADHAPWTATTTVAGGQTARVTGSMERIR
jgi:hypothetical protein